MKKALNNISKYTFAIFIICLLSIGFKFSALDHGLPNWNTNDVQHVHDAIIMRQDFEKAKSNPENKDLLKKAEKHWTKPHKYPLGLTRLYFYASEFFDVSFDGQFTKNLIIPNMAKLSRQLHLVLFALLLFLLYKSPFPKNLTLLAILLCSVSFVAHHYSVLLRIHLPTGIIGFGAFVSSALALDSKRPYLWILLGSLVAGYATGCFFTGAISYLPVLMIIFFVWKNKSLNLFSSIGLLIASFALFFIAFEPNHPTLLESLKQGKLTLDENYSGHFKTGEGSIWTLNHQMYLNVLFGMELLGGIGFLAGLYTFFKLDKGKDPKWALFIYPSLLYLIFIGLLQDSNVRRVVLVLGPLLLIAAKGWLWLFSSKNSKAFTYAFFAIAIFQTASIIKHAIISQKDTRQMSLDFVYNNLDNRRLIILDDLGITLTRPTNQHPFKKFTAMQNRLNMYTHFYKTHPVWRKHCKQAGVTPEDFASSEKLAETFKKIQVQYYIWNSSWALRDLYINPREVKKTSSLIASFSPAPNKPDGDIQRWPNNDTWLLWNVWAYDAVGPTVEIWRMPWAMPDELPTVYEDHYEKKWPQK